MSQKSLNALLLGQSLLAIGIIVPSLWLNMQNPEVLLVVFIVSEFALLGGSVIMKVMNGSEEE